MSLQGKNVIITGATSGIGVQMAAILSKAGASVFIGGRRADTGIKVAKETNTTFHPVDVADEQSNKTFFAAAEKHFGGKKEQVDFIFLNAGVEGDGSETMVQNLNIDTYDYIYNVNVRGVMLGLQYGTPLFRQGGTFVFTSSVGSVMAFAGNPVYASSKAAVDSLARCYAAQFAESEDGRIQSLSVVTMNPAAYGTAMLERFVGGQAAMMEVAAKMSNPSQRLGTAEELAGLVLAFVHGELPYGNGDNFVVDADTHFPLGEYQQKMAELKRAPKEDAKIQ